MNVKCTLNGTIVYIVDKGDMSGSRSEIMYVKASDKKMYLGLMSWDSAGALTFTEIRELAITVTAIDGVLI